MSPTALLLAAAMLAQPECRADSRAVHELAPLVEAAEQAYRLPPATLAAVVLAESGATPLVVVRRGVSSPGYACDVGVAGIGVPGCRWPRVQALLNPALNLHEGARLLARSRTACARHPGWPACRRSPFALYNAGSPRWPRRVEAIRARLLAEMGGRI